MTAEDTFEISEGILDRAYKEPERGDESWVPSTDLPYCTTPIGLDIWYGILLERWPNSLELRIRFIRNIVEYEDYKMNMEQQIMKNKEKGNIVK